MNDPDQWYENHGLQKTELEAGWVPVLVKANKCYEQLKTPLETLCLHV